MRRKRKKYIVRKFQTTPYRDSFILKNLFLGLLLTLSLLFFLHGFNKYRNNNSVVPSAKTSSQPIGEIRVRILNSSGQSDLAELLANKLKENDIIPIVEKLPGKYSSTPTLIINRSGNGAKVKKLAEIIGCDNVTSKVERNDNVDAIVIIGADLRSLRK